MQFIGPLFLLISFIISNSTAAEGLVTIKSVPAGAQIYFSPASLREWKVLTRTPVSELNFPEGVYDFMLIKPDYDTCILASSVIYPGQLFIIEQKLVSSYARISIHTNPDSSTVYLDDIKLGLTPYSHNLILPGSYQIRAYPKESIFRPFTSYHTLKKGDSLTINTNHRYRGQTLSAEVMPLTPWELEVNTGIQRLSIYGHYLKKGQDTLSQLPLELPGHNFPIDSIPIDMYWPLNLHLGLPGGLELYIKLPFRQYSPSRDISGTWGPGDLALGAKVSFNKYHSALNISYKFANGSTAQNRGSGYQSLTIMAIGQASKKAFTGLANAAYEFRFSKSDEQDYNFGDRARAFAQCAYIMNPLSPYIAVNGTYSLPDKLNGSQSLDNGAYTMGAQAGINWEPSETLGVQVGIPFTVIGENSSKYWGLQLSLGYSFRLE